jgi:phosphoenolpyruvate carboxylase
MTETAEEIISVQEAFHEISTLKHPLLKFEIDKLEHIEMIPLFEQVEVIMDSANIIDDYLTQFKNKFKFQPEYLRPYMARSDPTLNSGNIATVLAIKIALSRYAQYEKEKGVKMFPIIGAAALPFRGGITPENVSDFVNEYAGIRTTLLQSAFRYDYPLTVVKQGIKELNTLLPKVEARFVPEDDILMLKKIIEQSEKYYRGTIEGIADVVNNVANYIPKRRERVQHIGLFGYFRGVGKVQLPRAIKFTGALYSLGVPPEVIGTGRAIADLVESGEIEYLEKYYLNLKSDLERVSRYVNKSNLKRLVDRYGSIWEHVYADINAIEKYLGHEVGPVTDVDRSHCAITNVIFDLLDNVFSDDIFKKLIEQAAVLRKSIG